MFVKWLKQELFGGWNKFEAAWLAVFLLIQAAVFVHEPDSWPATIAAVSGILCVVFVGKGKISNYFFGLVSVSLYAYVAYTFEFYGEAMLNLLVYVPVQFVGFAMWRNNMAVRQAGADEVEEVKAKSLTPRQWLWVGFFTLSGTLAYIEVLLWLDSKLPTLDGITVVISIVAQVLMLLRYREQWVLWIVANILTIALWLTLWLESGETSLPLLTMYCMYLANSLYGYANWARLVQHHAPKVQTA